VGEVVVPLRWRYVRPDVVELVPGLLIGSAPDPRAVRVLADRGVTHVLDLRRDDEGPTGEWPAGVTVRHEPIPDGSRPTAQQLDEVVGWVRSALDRNQRVLVHCRAGVGRSATVGIAVLVRGGMPLSQAWNLVHELRPAIAPTDAQMSALLEYASRTSTIQSRA
jgi:protein-tyrosine phosphatase